MSEAPAKKNVLIVFAHPNPASFCAAMHQKAVESLTAAGHTVVVSDLHAMGFDPVNDARNFSSLSKPEYFKQQIEEMYASEHGTFAPDVAAELAKLEACDLLMFVFPLHWFALPSMLKGWVDRVFVMGKTYGGGKIYDTGVFKGKKAVLVLTTGGPAPAYLPGDESFNGDMMAILKPIHRGIFNFCGFSVLRPEVAYGPAHLDEPARIARLEEWAARARTLVEEEPIVVGKYKA